MAWIEAHEDIWEHHKTVKFCRMLGISKPQAVGHLLALWHFTLRNAWKDSDLAPWGPEEIERAVYWEGEKNVMLKALQECGFLEEFIVHGWQERAGRLVYDRKRKLSERRAAEKRRTSGGKSKATVPNRTVPYPTIRKENEKRVKFIRPDSKEVTAYAREIGFSLDGQKFVDHYEARGWQYKTGQPMKDWQAAVRTWRGNDFGGDKRESKSSESIFIQVARRGTAKKIEEPRRKSGTGARGFRSVSDIQSIAASLAGGGNGLDGAGIMEMGKGDGSASRPEETPEKT